MGRLARETIVSDYHHVMTQGISKSAIFKEDANKVKIYNLICETNEEKKVCILAYCIMDNHMHILLKVSDVTCMSEFMKVVNVKYARYFNKKYNRVGYVFRDRYKSQPILCDAQLMRCIRYIHNNPVKAKIVERMDAYYWSSYNEISKNEYRMVDKVAVDHLFANGTKTSSNSFRQFHEAVNDDEYIFLEEQDIVLNEEQDEIKVSFLKTRGISLEQVRNDRNILTEYSDYLKEEANMSQRQIAEWVGIGRETFRKKVLTFGEKL